MEVILIGVVAALLLRCWEVPLSNECVTFSRMKCAICCWFQYFKSLDSMVSRQFYTVFAPLYFRMFGWVLLGFQEPLDLTRLEFLLTEYV